MHATIAAEGGPDAGAGAHVFAVGRLLIDIARAVVALLGALLHSVAAVASEFAVEAARAVAAVVDPVVAVFAGVLGAVAATNATMRIASGLGARGGRVALFRSFDHAVAARDERDEALAIGRARPRHAAVDAVVTHLVELGVDLLVAAVRGRLAVVVALVAAVSRPIVLRSQVASFGRGEDAIAAVVGERAIGIASVVTAVVLTVVTLLGGVGRPLDAVAAPRAEHAGRGAFAVAKGIGSPVVALLAGVFHAVAAFQGAVRGAFVARAPVVDTVVAHFLRRIGLPIAAFRTNETIGRAMPIAGAIGGTFIALFVARNFTVAAVRGDFAPRAALRRGATIGGGVDPVVTFFGGPLRDVVAAIARAAVATGETMPVEAIVHAVVANLVAYELAVAAMSNALGDGVHEAGER